ncbi:SDR family NAD(P)-dependent oxidoreductase [Paludisphaera mucosa]|uniref:SDR family NAD(P)-dependent oxidoreductase n=1 Tax=Paludisphaera mucosa TaxID=3030827 RepID=A0ABT6FER8_9BACT|nr:SDR family NAD(P)-dependent oxidoreductase [Paludisphaera mucosa]MDG3006066.1 SDR family NAD(P)-dependent oxidoreductase [Paludisphaera mucosa]
MHSGVKKALAITAAGVGAAIAARAFVRHRRMISLAGRTVLITGGSRGLGLVLAREFAHQGARIAICARDGDELARARADLAARGADAATFVCDVTDQSQVDRTVDQVLDRFGRLDVLVNNAGVIQVGPFEETTVEDFEEAMATHFWGPLYTTLAVLPSMRERGEGRILNIASIGGKVAAPHLLPYSSSKFALIGFSEGLRAELLKDGIYVTAVAPGLMRTGSIHKATFKGQHQKEFAWFAIGDSIPGLSMSAESAARKIVDAARHGDAEAILSLPAHLMAKAHGLFPGLFADAMGLMNRFVFPAPGGIGKRKVEGKDSRSALAPAWATILSDRAAFRNNEL